jgi:hypothetical protein
MRLHHVTDFLVAAFAVLAGRILPELEPQLANAEQLSALRGYIATARTTTNFR